MAGHRTSTTSTTSSNSMGRSIRSSLQHKMDLAQMPPVYKIPLWDLNCQFDMVKLAAQDRKLALAATVKETGTDDQGLLEFYKEYFHSYPIYQDEKWQLYKAMGGRKLGILTILKAMLGARKRLKAQNIVSSKQNHKTDGWMAGGVLIFDKKGQLIYVLEEQAGKPFDMDKLKLAIAEARRSNLVDKQNKQQEDYSESMHIQEDAQTVRSSMASDTGSALEE
ncbi:expressed unknown protein [Seminavis robusta]|uniref:Uncharacterized protein n=1 Tax=Seminavis robusta TaxID=568900 RepID=A0A9N8HPS4_9STRA|nr:expressed unknown protein [Seminavis robusta]|eukprot:Sro923_g220770.1 n/a (222) ;mRNA; r:32498-33304